VTLLRTPGPALDQREAPKCWHAIVGKGAFVGSNSSLVALVTIGKGAYVGSVITRDIPAMRWRSAEGSKSLDPAWIQRLASKLSGKHPKGA
jgi:bifunctional UDP-N-acetylglucosamine pyrophosphorylase / glucosamine-1-phosphate N-acetyltransferase